jgi:tetratricopeptide (TPR) repeat protein
LQDLDEELAAGDLDEADYRTLRDSYLARAAAALRQLGGVGDEAGEGPASGAEPAPNGELASGAELASPGHSAPTAGAEATVEGMSGELRTPRPWLRRALGALALVAAAGLAAWAVVAFSGSRLPGQEITGQALGSQAVAQLLQQAQNATDRGDELTAVKDYQKILSAQPNQAEALTGEGWVLAETQQPALLQQGVTMLTAAERAAPTYAPAHVYRGVALLSEDDYAGAIPELQWYLAHNPDAQLVPRVRAALQEALAKAAAAKPSG